MICRRPAPCLLVLLTLALAGCRRERTVVERTPPLASASAKPLDHLAPGELAEGDGRVFGFAVPRELRIKGVFLEVAYLEGEVTPEALANYVRERVDAEHVEIGAVSTVFPRVRVKGGAPGKLYDFEVRPRDIRTTTLVIRDVTPLPPNPRGMTDAERWRQAGYAPDGTPIDPKQLQ